MKKTLLVLALLTSTSVFAQGYDCTFTLVKGINAENPEVQDSAKLSLTLGSSDESRLQLAKKSVKVQIDRVSQKTFKGQMFLMAWVSDSTAVGPMDNEGFLSGSVSKDAQVIQLSTQIKGEFYNLVCSKK